MKNLLLFGIMALSFSVMSKESKEPMNISKSISRVRVKKIKKAPLQKPIDRKTVVPESEKAPKGREWNHYLTEPIDM